MSLTSFPNRLAGTPLIGLALLAALAQSPAQATTTAEGSGYTGIVNAGGTLQTPIDLTTGALPQGGMSVGGSGSTVGHLGNGNVTATAAVDGEADASYGLLRARVAGSLFATSANPADLPFVNGSFDASFEDAVVVSSSTLAIGSPVTLQMTMSLDVVITENQGALFYVRYQLGNASGQVVDLARGSQTLSSIPGQVYGFTAPVTFADTVGDTLHVSSMLQVGISQYFNGQSYQFGPLEGSYIYNQPSIDASHTSKVFLDSLTPDVTLVAASGHDYSTAAAVPEPTTALLLLAGLGVVARARRRSRHESTDITP